MQNFIGDTTYRRRTYECQKTNRIRKFICDIVNRKTSPQSLGQLLVFPISNLLIVSGEKMWESSVGFGYRYIVWLRRSWIRSNTHLLLVFMRLFVNFMFSWL